MKSKTIIAFLGIASAAAAFPAAAQMSMSSAYLGGGIGQSKFKDACIDPAGAGPSSCDDKDAAWKLFGGYRFSRNFAAELGYSDLGRAKASSVAGDTEAKGAAWELSGIGSIPFDAFSVFGRLGAYRGQSELSGLASGDKVTWNATYGAGVQYDFNRALGVRGEWQRYASLKLRDAATGAETEPDVDVLGVSLLYRFQ